MKRFKRILSILLSAAVISQMGVTPAFAAEGDALYTPADERVSAQSASLPETNVSAEATAEVMSMDYDIGTASLAINGEDGCTAGAPHIITGSTGSNTVTVDGGTHFITLNSVNINTYYTPSIDIKPNTTVNLTLLNDNSLTSQESAALYVRDDAALVITEASTGKLTATSLCRWFAVAGIGSPLGEGCGDITINGGIITAAGSPGLSGDLAVSIGGINTDDNRIVIDGDAVVFAKISSLAPQPTPMPVPLQTPAYLEGSVAMDFNELKETVSSTSTYLEGNVTRTKGVIFEGGVGKVYGEVTLPGNVEIPSDNTLTIDSGVTLTVPSGVTLTNNGTIDVYGTLNSGAPAYGTVTGKVNRYKNAQSAAVSLFRDGAEVPKAEPGAPNTLRLTVEKPAYAARAAFTEPDKANFYLGTDSTGTLINTAPVTFTEVEGKLVAEVEWTPDTSLTAASQDIFVEYGTLTAGGDNFVNPGTASGTVAVQGLVEVDNGGTKTEYATIQAAISAIGATDGCTLKLLSNIDLGNSPIVIEHISLTLDLNGKTLTSTTNGTVPLLNYAGAVGKTLTIRDDGMGGMVKNLGKGWAISNSSTGEISITGGTISANDSFTILNSSGTLTVTGGMVENTRFGNAISSSVSGVVTISGNAKVTSTYGAAIYLSGNGVEPENSLVVKGGTVENTGTVDGAIYNSSTGAVSITGGTVISKAMYTICNYSTGSISVSGGMVLAKGGIFGTLYNASTGSIFITGGTVIHQADGGFAVYNASTGAVSFTGGLILGEYANNNSSTDISWSMKGAQTLPISATLPAGITFTIPKDSTLTIPSEVTLTNSGTLKLFGALDGTGTLAGSGSFTAFGAEDITIPNQYYTGSPITPTPTLAATRTVMGKDFTVSSSDYTGPVYADNAAVGTAKATYTYTADPSLTMVKNFNIVQSDTEFVGGITTDKTDKTYTYGETITATVTPKATGAAPRARTATAPTAGQIALFLGDTQITEPQNATNGTALTFTIDTKDKTLAAGSNTITAKYVGTASMADYSENVTVKLNPKPISSATVSADETRDYNGKSAFTDVALTPNPADIFSGDTVTATADGNAASANVGTHSFTATGVTLSGAQGSYYSLAASAVSGSVTITAFDPSPNVVGGSIKINGKLANIQGQTASGVNGEAVAGTFTWSETAGGAALDDSFTFTGDVGDEVILYVTFTPTSGNYKAWLGIYGFTLTDKDVPLLTVENLTKTYDGVAATTVTGTAKVGNTTVPGTFAFYDAPLMMDAGAYNAAVQFTPTDTASYDTAAIAIAVIISKATITIKANDKSAFVGDAVPTFSETDYTVSGLVNGVTLKTKPTLAYASTPDMSQAGSVAILASGAAAPDGGNYNDIVFYQPGTLTIRVKGGGTTPTPPQESYPLTNGSATISRSSLQDLEQADTSLTVSDSNVTLVFDKAAVPAILDGTSGDVTFSATKANISKFPDAVATIGNRPVYNFTVKGASGKTVADFGKGSVSVSISYTLQSGETAQNVQAVFVENSGKVTWLAGSSYDSDAKLLRLRTNHFSVYSVGYQQNTAEFTDIDGHWAQDDILFVTKRGLFFGTSSTTFSPNAGMTRGMFVTVLGRLAGADISKYPHSKFNDVKANSYYAPYVAWANENGIVNGTGATTFSPDNAIKRQEMAVMLANYSKSIGYKLPPIHDEVIFDDAANISSWAQSGVKQMQMAGILLGKSGNKFDPTATATRAEVSAMLRRFVELVITPKAGA